jgi:hypothetical protein
MRKVAIQAAGYIYFAEAFIFMTSAVLNLFDDQPTHLFVSCVSGAVAAFAAYMGVKSRTYLRMSPVPSRTQIAVGAAATMLVGGLAGSLFVIALLVPYSLLVWAVQPRTA